MKKKLLSLVLVLALALTALTAVGCGSGFSNLYKDPTKSDVYKQFAEQTSILNTATDLNLDYQPISQLPEDDPDEMKNLVVFRNSAGTSYKVYNMETNKVVSSFDNAEGVVYNEVALGVVFGGKANYDYFKVEKTTTKDNVDTDHYEFYNADGTLIEAVEGDEPRTFVVIDTLFIDGSFFRVNKNGKFEKAGTISENVAWDFADTLFIAENGGRYYAVDMFQNYNALLVYDSSFTLKSYFETPTYVVDDPEFFVLNDGNVLIQYETPVDMFGSDYTYYDNGKVKVDTLIYNVKDGKAKAIDTEYIVNRIYARNANYGSIEIATTFAAFNDGIKDFAIIKKINNKLLDTNSQYVSLKNDGKVDKALTELFVGQRGTPELISSGRFVIRDKTGASFLVNADGKILANITGSRYNNSYIVLDGQIYNHDFKAANGGSFDKDKWGMVMMNHSIVLYSLEEYEAGGWNMAAVKHFKLFAEDKFTEITLGDNEMFVGGNLRCYVIRKVDADTNVVSYTIYNELGASVLTTSLELDPVGTARNGKILLSAYDNANGKFVNIVLSTALK